MISSEFKLIFLHFPKTGGNSIQTALKHISDDEFYQRIERHDGINDFAIRNSTYADLTKHASLADYATAMGSQFRKYRVFTVLRNPFDRVTSHYFYEHKFRSSGVFSYEKFSDFVRSTPPILENFLSRKHLPYLWPPKFRKLDIDRFLRFEKLEEDFYDYMKVLGVPNVTLPALNVSENRMHYRECFKPDLVEFVKRKHSFELELGGYSY